LTTFAPRPIIILSLIVSCNFRPVVFRSTTIDSNKFTEKAKVVPCVENDSIGCQQPEEDVFIFLNLAGTVVVKVFSKELQKTRFTNAIFLNDTLDFSLHICSIF